MYDVELDLVRDGNLSGEAVVAQIDDALPTAALVAGLSAAGFSVPAVHSRTGQDVAAGQNVGGLCLRHGDVLVPGHGAREAAPMRLEVMSGPHEGMSFPLMEGVSHLGRSREHEVSLNRDGKVSAGHATLHVHNGQVSIVDGIVGKPSANGTFVDGVAIDSATVVLVGSMFRVGESRMLVVANAPTPAQAHLKRDGATIQFTVSPPLQTPRVEASAIIPPPPSAPSRRRIPMISALGPVIMGLVIFSVTKNPLSLLTVLVSPLLMIGSVLEDRRGGRAAHAKQVEAWKGTSRERLDEAQASHARIADARRSEAPDGRTIAAFALACTTDVWARLPGRVGFGILRVGLADQPSRVRVAFGEGGDPALREPLAESLAALALDRDVPVTIDLDAGVIALTGSPSAVSGLARSLVVQAASLHSPRHLRLAVIATDRSAWSWADRLPHVRDDNGTPSIAGSGDDARAMFSAMQDLVEGRIREIAKSGGQAQRLLLVVEAPVDIPQSELSSLLLRASRASVSVVFLAATYTVAPAETAVAVDADTGVVQVIASGAAITSTVERLDEQQAGRIVRALAPLRDLSGAAGSSIPASYSLFQALNLTTVDSAVIETLWKSAPPEGKNGDGLKVVVGATADGPLALTVFGNKAPNGLVGGTAGAGKSEFLQGLVGALAASYSPQRVSFVFIDFGGGAAFKDCVPLPHTAGILTSLDSHLIQRVKRSLVAERYRREAILAAAGAKDIAQMMEVAPDQAPPRLIIIIDEFADLIRTEPEFVKEVVEMLTAVGRKLGLHLLLATQSPGQSINDMIKANVTMKVALRVASDTESIAVVGAADAAMIPATRPGRAVVQMGKESLRPFQSSYAAAKSGGVASELPDVVDIRRPGEPAPQAAAVDVAPDLLRVVEACREAAENLRLPQVFHPWADDLPIHIAADELSALADDSHDAAPVRSGALGRVAIGLLDLPDKQRRVSLHLDLEATGHAMVVGASHAGKSTTLRTIVTSLCALAGPEELHVYGIDMSSSLSPLEGLPNIGTVAHDEQLQRRLLTQLTDMIGQRRAAMVRSGAQDLRDLEARGTHIPRVLLVIDDFPGWWPVVQAWGTPDEAKFHGLLASGSSVGVHVLIGSDRKESLPFNSRQAIGTVLVHRLNSVEEYRAHGVQPRTTLPAGRVLLPGDSEAQIAVTSIPAATAARRVVDPWDEQDASRPMQIGVMPDDVPFRALKLGAERSEQLPMALDVASMQPVGVDFSVQPAWLVIGSVRSGKSTTLTVAARAEQAYNPEGSRILLRAKRDKRAADPVWTEVVAGVDAVKSRLLDLVITARERVASEGGPAMLVALDDGDEVLDATDMETFCKLARDAEIGILVSANPLPVIQTFSGWIKLIKGQKCGFLLQPDHGRDGTAMDVNLGPQRGAVYPVGRGFLISKGSARLVQVVNPSE